MNKPQCSLSRHQQNLPTLPNCLFHEIFVSIPFPICLKLAEGFRGHWGDLGTFTPSHGQCNSICHTFFENQGNKNAIAVTSKALRQVSRGKILAEDFFFLSAQMNNFGSMVCFSRCEKSGQLIVLNVFATDCYPSAIKIYLEWETSPHPSIPNTAQSISTWGVGDFGLGKLRTNSLWPNNVLGKGIPDLRK